MKAAAARSVLALAAAVMVAGCGYQLRGTPTAAVAKGLDAVVVAGSGAIVGDILSAVEGGGGSVAPAADQAALVIRVIDDRFERRLLTVEATTGKSQEFQLSYRVTFSAAQGDGAKVLAPQTVRLVRDFAIDADALIGTIRQEEVIRVEMRRDAAGRVVQRVEAALR